MNLASFNTIGVTTKADGSASGSNSAGGTVALAVVTDTTDAHIDGGVSIHAASVGVSAASTNDTPTTATSTAGGSTQNDPSTQNDLTKYDANTSAGNVGVAAALAITDLTRETQAYIASSGPIVVTGKINVGTDASTTATAGADGSATNGATGVAVAVAINRAHADNSAYVSGSLSANELNVSATNPTGDVLGARPPRGRAPRTLASPALSRSTSSRTRPRRPSPPAPWSLRAGRSHSRHRTQRRTQPTRSRPTRGRRPRANWGFGASVAVDVVTATTTAALQDGASLTGAGNLVLSATGSHTVTTTAVNGAAATGGSGTGIGITAAVAIVNNSTVATLGTASSPLAITGALSATATQTDVVMTSANGKAAGSNGVGIAIAVNVVTDSATASTAQSIKAGGAVTFAASSNAASTATATATAAGGQQSDGKSGSDVDSQVSDQVSYGDTQASNSGSQGAPAGTKAPAAQNSSGTTVSLAGGIGVNIATNESSATLAQNLTVTAGGPLTLTRRTRRGPTRRRTARPPARRRWAWVSRSRSTW